MLAGKRLVLTGVLTRNSIAFEVARQAQEAGAEVILTGFGRTRRMTERAASRLPQPVEILELDVNNPDDLTALTRDLRERWGRVDGVLHAIAHAPGDALGGAFLEAPTASALAAFQTRAISLRELAVAVGPLIDEAGG
ncbi:MAG: fabI, partial [Solirubrobacterales bacterium]|nr:fabI [Solirubrobacterales bacterium]